MTPAARLRICKMCPDVNDRGLLSTCGVCGCFLQAKVRLKTQCCPVGKWGPVDEWSNHEDSEENHTE